MNRSRVSDAGFRSQGDFQGLIDRNANLRQQALNHNLGRNVRVAQVLTYVGLLRQSGTAISGAIECTAAVRQNFSSSGNLQHMGLPAPRSQAAHFLPGQVRMGGRNLWQWFSRHTSPAVEFLFAEVEHLPLAFNQADSEAENKGRNDGLCAALAQACTAMVQARVLARPQPGVVDRNILSTAFGEWCRGATAAFQRALLNKRQRAGIPPLVGNAFDGYTMESIEARSQAPASQFNRDEALGVLELYAQDQARYNQAWLTGACQPRIREAESNFRV